MGETMKSCVEKKDYLERLLSLADAMLAALNGGDQTMAAEIFDERERYMAENQPGPEPAPEGLVDRLLARDREVMLAANKCRQTMIESGTQLKGVRDYQSKLPSGRSQGNWGSS